MRSKKAIYNIITNIVLQLVTIIYGFVVPRIIISKFGSDVNGLVVSITQFLAYITLLESGFGPVVKAVLYRPIANKDKKTIVDILRASEKFFRKIALIFVLYIIILFFIYPLIVDKTFDAVFTITLIAIIGISTFAEYFFGMTYRLFLQAKQKTYVISIIQIITYILSLVAIIVLAVSGANVFVIKLVSGLIFVLRPIFQNLYVKRKYAINLSEGSSNYKIKQKWDGLAQHIAAVIHNNTDITVLTLFCSLAEVSVYSVYYLVVKGIKLLIQAFVNGVDATFGDMIAKKENDNLMKKFSIFECFYFTIVTIVFACTIVLITPFISVFMQGVTDANYIRPIFGMLLVISEFAWAVRLPYSSITLAAGHFKETRIGAWVECLSNIIISVVLVNWLGIIGVAIGTIVAMSIRTIEFVYHTNKYVIRRSNWESVKKILLVIIETIIIVLICNLLPYLDNVNYLNWIINALMVFGVSMTCVLAINMLFFRKDLKKAIKLIKGIMKRKGKKRKAIQNEKIN